MTYIQWISPSNNYGELFAIHCCADYIDTTNRRVIIFTDSLNNFLPLLTTPIKYQNKLQFPSLFKQTQYFLIKHNVILWKIKSHTDPIHWFNDCADSQADKGRIHPNNNKHIIPNVTGGNLRRGLTQFDFQSAESGRPGLVAKLARNVKSTCDLESLFNPD